MSTEDLHNNRPDVKGTSEENEESAPVTKTNYFRLIFLVVHHNFHCMRFSLAMNYIQLVIHNFCIYTRVEQI
jgi:hypothetical protein